MYIAAIGEFEAFDRHCLTLAARRAAVDVAFVESADALADAATHRGHKPICVFVPRQHDPSAMIATLRDMSELFAVPVLAFVEHPTETSFQTAFAGGADDALLSGDTAGVVRRIASLRSGARLCRPPKQHGLAIIASSNISRRRQLGRTLRQAGFDITFASEPGEVQFAARGPVAPRLLVATRSFPPSETGGSGPLQAATPGMDSILLPQASGFALERTTAPETSGELLFLAEEALRGAGQPGVQERRTSRRIHFATLCSFRHAGDMQPSYALTHNISAGGLYLRTLDLPATGTEVWIEMRPPHGLHTVHLRAEVVAVTQPGSGAARPVGFGVKLLLAHTARVDADRYLDAYEQLAERNPACSN